MEDFRDKNIGGYLLKSASAWRIQGRRLREEKIARDPARVKRTFAFFCTSARGAGWPRRHPLCHIYRPVNPVDLRASADAPHAGRASLAIRNRPRRASQNSIRISVGGSSQCAEEFSPSSWSPSSQAPFQLAR